VCMCDCDIFVKFRLDLSFDLTTCHILYHIPYVSACGNSVLEVANMILIFYPSVRNCIQALHIYYASAFIAVACCRLGGQLDVGADV